MSEAGFRSIQPDPLLRAPKERKKIYLFEYVDLNDCIGEVLEDYSLLLKEKNFKITVQVPELSVYTDREELNSSLGQIVSNTVKYCTVMSGNTADAADTEKYDSADREKRPELKITLEQSGDRRCAAYTR